MHISTVALAVIGDEVLLGEVRDLNISIVAGEVFRLGADLGYACVLPDDPDFMLEHLSWMGQRYDWVVTTGGIGATHDDLTKQVISRLTGKPLIEAPEAITALEKRVGSPLSDKLRELALVPEGAELVTNEKTAAPGVIVGNMLVLPGIPSLVESMITILAEKLTGSKFYTAEVRTFQRESEIAAVLESVQEEYPAVRIGSYPIMEIAEYKVKMVLRSRDQQLLRKAERMLIERIGN